MGYHFWVLHVQTQAPLKKKVQTQALRILCPIVIFQVHLFIIISIVLPLSSLLFSVFMGSFHTTDLLGNSFKNIRAILARLAAVFDLVIPCCLSLSLMSMILMPYPYGIKLVFVCYTCCRGLGDN